MATKLPEGLFGGEYDHINDAAAAAALVASFQPRVAKQEYMTVLVEDPKTKKIRRAAFATDGSATGSSYPLYRNKKGEYFLKDGSRVVGLLHTHPPAKPGDKYPVTSFSDTDVNTAIDGMVPSFVAGMPDRPPNQPTQSSVYHPRPSHRNSIQPGEQYLAQFPIDEWKMQIALRIRNSNISPDMKARLLESLIVPAPVTQR